MGVYGDTHYQQLSDPSKPIACLQNKISTREGVWLSLVEYKVGKDMKDYFAEM